jgi:uncharacterized membrane protein YbhN (UPF0104 family)
MPEGSRLKSISVTLVGSLSQLLITFYSGIVGLIILKNDLVGKGILNEIAYRLGSGALCFAVLLLTIFYLWVQVIENAFEKWLKRSGYLYLIESLRSFNLQLLLRLLLLSFLRYLVFIFQYYLLFSLFDVVLPLSIIWSVVSVLFLAMAVIPTIALAEVGLKGEIGIRLMGLFTSNTLGVGIASVGIWLINLVLPAIVGSILFLSIKVFKRKNESV